jgi:hypothetical protein
MEDACLQSLQQSQEKHDKMQSSSGKKQIMKLRSTSYQKFILSLFIGSHKQISKIQWNLHMFIMLITFLTPNP